jgi:hypothetical protein
VTAPALRPASIRVARYRRWTRACGALIVAMSLVGILVPAGLGWDFANFYDAGRRVAAGESANLYQPHSLIAGQPPQGTTGFYGTPISALFYLPISGARPTVALVLFKVANVAAFFATFVLLFRFYAPFAGSAPEARWAFAAWLSLLCLLYQPFWTVFRVGGQTTPFVLLAAAVALRCHVRGQFWGSAACLVVAALIKPSLAPPLLFLMLISGLAFFWRTAAVLAASGVLSLALLGWPVHLAFLDLMRHGSQLTYAWYYNSSLFILPDNLRTGLGPRATMGVYPAVLAALAWALRALAVATAAAPVVRSRVAHLSAAARRHIAIQMAFVLFLLLSLTVWEHYLSLLFPLLAYLIAVRRDLRRGAIALVAAIVVLAVGQNLILVNWLRAHVAFDSLTMLLTIALLKSGPLTLTVVLLWRYGRDLVATHRSPAWTSLAAGTRPA